MTARSPVAFVLGFETFGTAAGLSLVTGALSLIAPTLTVLAGTLAALAMAGWASLRYRERSRGGAGSRTRWLALVAAAAGGLVYLDPPGPLRAIRGLLLGVALVPLWFTERRAVRRAAVVGSPG